MFRFVTFSRRIFFLNHNIFFPPYGYSFSRSPWLMKSKVSVLRQMDIQEYYSTLPMVS